MTQSVTRKSTDDAVSASLHSSSEHVERRIRQIHAWLVLYLLLQAEFGLAWDRQWHDLVGRDRFWIPPHIMLYTGIGGVGLLALSMVVIDTIRYRHKAAGVDDSSTISVFGLFHAPLGFVMLGFGALTDLLAAPFDNYWHELYGIDVTLWSPFHIMGTIGSVLAGLGCIYIFASEAARERQTNYAFRTLLGFTGFEWGALILLAAFMELSLPALTAFTPIPIGSISLLTYPLILAFAGGGCIIGAIRLTHKPGAATLTALLLWVEALATQAFVPWALRATVANYGLSFRYSGREPTFNLTLALMPLLFLVFALLVDTVAFLQRRQGTSSVSGQDDGKRVGAMLAIALALLAVVVPSSLVQALLYLNPTLSLPPDIVRVLTPQWFALALTFPLTLLIGAVAIVCGAFFGDIWHLNKH